jgi:hypothetical protein
LARRLDYCVRVVDFVDERPPCRKRRRMGPRRDARGLDFCAMVVNLVDERPSCRKWRRERRGRAFTSRALDRDPHRRPLVFCVRVENFVKQRPLCRNRRRVGRGVCAGGAWACGGTRAGSAREGSRRGAETTACTELWRVNEK